MHGVINIKDEDGFEPTSESTHLSLPTRYELANGFTSTPSRLLGDLEEKHLPQTFSIATRVAHDGIRIVVYNCGAAKRRARCMFYFHRGVREEYRGDLLYRYYTSALYISISRSSHGLSRGRAMVEPRLSHLLSHG